MTTHQDGDQPVTRTILRLSYGSHTSFEDGVCAMELASHLAREPWGDHPKCDVNGHSHE